MNSCMWNSICYITRGDRLCVEALISPHRKAMGRAMRPREFPAYPISTAKWPPHSGVPQVSLGDAWSSEADAETPFYCVQKKSWSMIYVWTHFFLVFMQSLHELIYTGYIYIYKIHINNNEHRHSRYTYIWTSNVCRAKLIFLETWIPVREDGSPLRPWPGRWVLGFTYIYYGDYDRIYISYVFYSFIVFLCVSVILLVLFHWLVNEETEDPRPLVTLERGQRLSNSMIVDDGNGLPPHAFAPCFA